MENKVYNLKKSSLGKVSFLEGTSFCMIEGKTNNNQKFKELIIVRTVEEAIKKFPQWWSEVIYSNIEDKLTFDNKIIDWLIQEWEKGIISLKNEMYENFAIEEIKNMSPVEFIRSEPEMIALTLVHITVRHTNGFLSVPVNNIEISIRFVKNILTINFWEEGNPKTEKPQI
ncbi:hypothetical protein [Spiroplasma floricola]|uniref:Uncharacterized protein n=1 Tax=Spiroplasma floricola 23-6 TaxID=1336749 RepID=A0A2K8SDP1_9MOLU|nr:hypothetical protein [Spiroplasma floricola]AUB31542.1 hypothetical protein SFLOR_v1c04900 [Spiroplasma floricola 23-6]